MIRRLGSAVPKIHSKAFVHDSAELIGAVSVGASASVWPLAVLRGDVDRIVIGERSNIQDMTVVHCRKGRPCLVGRGVTVGHRVVLHGARVGDGCLIGMGSVILEADIGPRCLVAAGSLVLAGLKVPAGSLVYGAPAKVARRLRPRELRMLSVGESSYLRLSRLHRCRSRPVFP